MMVQIAGQSATVHPEFRLRAEIRSLLLGLRREMMTGRNGPDGSPSCQLVLKGIHHYACSSLLMLG